MCKIFLVIWGAFVSVSVCAQTCIGGTEYEGKNGHVYCYSNYSVNWWTAFRWCASQGRHLATPEEICDYMTGTFPRVCYNLDGISSEVADFIGWTSLAAGNGKAYRYHRNAHAVDSQSVLWDGRAICY